MAPDGPAAPDAQGAQVTTESPIANAAFEPQDQPDTLLVPRVRQASVVPVAPYSLLPTRPPLRRIPSD